MKRRYKLSVRPYRTLAAIGLGVRPRGKANVIEPDDSAIEQLRDWSQENQLF
ncbi:MAG: hypothetical protein IJB92_08750 [Clostridia bacterium]|nr:hypothetical protein [Clostridia bacterium]MBQ2817761.1 hypothetical protein [Clostridia bacterium]MBQ4638810.1 hypothetical protein [Clostridia bacterium]